MRPLVGELVLRVQREDEVRVASRDRLQGYLVRLGRIVYLVGVVIKGLVAYDSALWQTIGQLLLLDFIVKGYVEDIGLCQFDAVVVKVLREDGGVDASIEVNELLFGVLLTLAC